MDKIWYILIDGQKEGPYNVQDLRRHFRVTPDTLVWKEGFKDWIQIRYVPELKALFEDTEEEEPEEPKRSFKPSADSQLALAVRSEPPTFLFWLVIILIIVAYVFYQFSK